MLCAYPRSDEHVVPGDTGHVVSGLGIRIEEGCGACIGMLAFRSSGSRLPGLGLKLGFRRGTVWTSSSGRGDEVLSEAPYGEEPIGASQQHCWDAFVVFYNDFQKA